MDNERSLGERLQVLKLMNFIDLIKKSFSDSWTGGASIDPRTGLQGAPNRFHGKGAFDDFKMADIFDKDRWVREKMGDPNAKSDRQQWTNYYIPRYDGRKEAAEVTETNQVKDGLETNTIVRKYKDPGYPNYEPNPGDDLNWRAFPGNFEMPQANLRRVLPDQPGQQGLPSISRAQQYMPPQSDINNQRLGMNPGGVRVQRPIPEGVNEMTNSYRPLPRSGIGTLHGKGRMVSELGGAGTMLSKAMPSGLHPGWESGYGVQSPIHGSTAPGIRSKQKQEIAKILEFLGYLYGDQ
jgi:hypothetical protein